MKGKVFKSASTVIAVIKNIQPFFLNFTKGGRIELENHMPLLRFLANQSWLQSQLLK